jgi:hypothetical protein
LNLNLIETQTGKRVWEKKHFYELNFFEVISWISALPGRMAKQRRLLQHRVFA